VIAGKSVKTGLLSAGAVNGKLLCTVPSTGAYTVSLYSMNGKLVNTVYTGQLSAGVNNFALQGIAAGVYVLRIEGIASGAFRVNLSGL